MTWRLSPRRKKAAELIASGEYTMLAVAEMCGVSDRTLRKWRKAPEFDEYVQELERATREEAKRYLGRQALHAARRLVEISERGELKDRERLKATIEVLNRCGVIAVKGIEVGGVTPVVAILPAMKSDDAASVDPA